MISTVLFLSLIILVIATPQLAPPPPLQQQQTQPPKICSPVDILLSFMDPNRVLKEYLCSSA